MYFIDEFAKNVEKKGADIALTDNDGTRHITYAQLDSLSNKIANKLTSVGVKKGSAVIIILPRISEYIASEIAIFKLGGIVVPLIPEYPNERVSFIKKDCCSTFTITEDFVENIFDEEVSDSFIPKDISDDERGMFIYTSGSTGNPKGVVYKRNDIDEHIKVTLGVLAGIQPPVFGAAATMSFCFTVEEYFRNLVLGAHIHIFSDEVRSDSDRLADYCDSHGITASFVSPRILKNFRPKKGIFKRATTGSEKVVNIFSNDYEIICNYGQSETIGPVVEWIIDKAYDNTPVGKPIKGIEAIIVDKDDNQLENGQEGQICLIGKFPCEYNNLKELTEKTFSRLDDGRILVHTGDVGKFLPDGNLLFLNRNDWMIKIHGQRVEPGEIESVMNKVEGVTGSVVKAFDNEDGTMLLCGFYTVNKDVNKDDIVKLLKANLPNYMIPSVFVKMDAFPVNANGKLDRKSIQKPNLSELTAKYEEPVGRTEKLICDAMSKLLNIKQIGRNDNFTELGGNSLNVVSLCGLCGIEGLSPQLVMIGQTPANIAKLIEDNYFYPKPKLEISGNIKDVYPLSYAQRYQNQFCHDNGVSIDVIDMIYFFKLDASIDIDKLKNAVELTINEHPIYRCHIDEYSNELYTDSTPFSVGNVRLTVEEFEKFRHEWYLYVRNLKTDPLIEAKILDISDGSTYLFIDACHLIYDGKSMSKFLKAISAKYNGTKEDEEQATIFDLIEYEVKLKQNAGLMEKAYDYFEDNYKGLKAHKFFENEKKYVTSVYSPILKDIRQSEIDSFIKARGISTLTLFQAAFELTVSQKFDVDDFCYMNIYDGRTNELLENAHGVFARPVFTRSEATRHTSMNESLSAIEKQYQRLVYYDVDYTFDVVKKFPSINSGILLNFRDIQGVAIKLSDKLIISDFESEHYEVNKPFSNFDFQINRLPREMGYTGNLISTKVSSDFAEKFVKSFEDNIQKILLSAD